MAVTKEDSDYFDVLKKSICELREIYKDKSDAKFTRWYSRKYKIPARDIERILSSK